MIITISGPPGSGKTTVGILLAEKMGRKFISTGMIFRQMAEEQGVSLAKFGEMAKMDHSIDKELDQRVLELALDNIVLEGRLAAHMLHLNGFRAFKVWIDAHPRIRAERIAGREHKNPDNVLEENTIREECEYQRYMQIYGIDSRNLGVYDMVIHSDEHTPDEIVNDILERFGNAA
jgi:predicted cytidylate kinase